MVPPAAFRGLLHDSQHDFVQPAQQILHEGGGIYLKVILAPPGHLYNRLENQFALPIEANRVQKAWSTISVLKKSLAACSLLTHAGLLDTRGCQDLREVSKVIGCMLNILRSAVHANGNNPSLRDSARQPIRICETASCQVSFP